ncbi:MAG: ABC transporter permease [Muribaculaceae bacterium]|nr:ABC transporter permease [Muribaculaceae bacterium]
MFSLRVAVRYLFSKKTHSAVNVISLISVAGVAVATMAIVCVLSVFNGFTDLAASHLSRLDPDIKVTPADGKVIANGDSLARAITGIDGVAAAIPTIEEQALAVYASRQMPVTIKGVPERYDSINSLPSIIIDGERLYRDSVRSLSFATLSVGAAMNLKAFPGGDRYLGLYVPRRKGRINPASPMTAFRSDSLIVSAVYQVEQAEYDADMVIIPIENARRMLDYTTEASAIEIKLRGDATAATVIPRVKAATGGSYEVKDRMQQQEQSFRMIEIEKWITFFMLAFILIIASFNIISTMSMLILEKAENIRTLHALGASRKMISRIFLIEGWLISIVGGIAGIVAGVALSLAQQWGGFIKLGGNHEAMSIDVYPVRVDPVDLLAVLAIVLIVGILTSAASGKLRPDTSTRTP